MTTIDFAQRLARTRDRALELLDAVIAAARTPLDSADPSSPPSPVALREARLAAAAALNFAHHHEQAALSAARRAPDNANGTPAIAPDAHARAAPSAPAPTRAPSSTYDPTASIAQLLAALRPPKPNHPRATAPGTDHPRGPFRLSQPPSTAAQPPGGLPAPPPISA